MLAHRPTSRVVPSALSIPRSRLTRRTSRTTTRLCVAARSACTQATCTWPAAVLFTIALKWAGRSPRNTALSRSATDATFATTLQVRVTRTTRPCDSGRCGTYYRTPNHRSLTPIVPLPLLLCDAHRGGLQLLIRHGPMHGHGCPLLQQLWHYARDIRRNSALHLDHYAVVSTIPLPLPLLPPPPLQCTSATALQGPPLKCTKAGAPQFHRGPLGGGGRDTDSEGQLFPSLHLNSNKEATRMRCLLFVPKRALITLAPFFVDLARPSA